MLQSWNEPGYSFDSGGKRAQYILSPAFHRMGEILTMGHFVLTLHLCKDYVKVWEPNHQRAECIWMLLYIFQIP